MNYGMNPTLLRQVLGLKKITPVLILAAVLYGEEQEEIIAGVRKHFPLWSDRTGLTDPREAFRLAGFADVDPASIPFDARLTRAVRWAIGERIGVPMEHVRNREAREQAENMIERALLGIPTDAKVDLAVVVEPKELPAEASIRKDASAKARAAHRELIAREPIRETLPEMVYEPPVNLDLERRLRRRAAAAQHTRRGEPVANTGKAARKPGGKKAKG